MKRWLFLVLLALASVSELSAQKLTIYCEDAPPTEFIGPDGQLTGSSVEMVQEIQKRVGNTDPIQMVPWARGYEEVQKKPNTVLFSLARTAERNQLFQWVGPILEMRFGFYTKADSPIVITKLEDAKRLRRIGVYNNDVRDQFLTKAGFTNLDRTNNNVQNFKKLMGGRIDAYTSTSIAIDDESKDAGYRASDVKNVFTFLSLQLYIGISKGGPSLFRVGNRAQNPTQFCGAA